MADASIDVLMRVVGAKGPLSAESRTVFSAATDNLRLGFMPGKFCELSEFSFSAGINSGDTKKEKEAKKLKELKRLAKKGETGDKNEALSPEQRRDNAMEKLIRSQEKRQVKHQKDEVIDMQPVEYTRTMDSMSTFLFQALVGCETLETISIIKRKAAGVASSGLTFLRLDFNKVLMTELEWKDGEHVMTESGTFIYRSVSIRYRPQLKDGTLGTVIQQDWTMPAGTR